MQQFLPPIHEKSVDIPKIEILSTEPSNLKDKDLVQATTGQTTSKTEKSLTFENDNKNRNFRFSRNNFLCRNSSLKIVKETELLKRIDGSISNVTNRHNDEHKITLKLLDKLENKDFKLNPLIYLSNNDISLLDEVTKQYEKTVKENNQSRGFSVFFQFSLIIWQFSY